MRTYVLFCMVLLFTHTVSAQVVSIIDHNTLQPVQDAVIHNEDQSYSITADYLGKAIIDSNLSSDSILFISHPSYETYFATTAILNRSDYTVRLRPKIILIDEIVVSANRWEQDKKQIPNRILTISPQDVELSNPQTTADMLGRTGQVFIQKSQLGGGSPMIRGFAANSVLIVVDGIRMNNAIFRSGNLQNVISIDPFSLENTEVLFGPGSVMYGSDALGGVMHFRTNTPGFQNQEKPAVNANSILRYSTADNEKTGHVDFTVSGSKISLFSSVTFSDFDHLRTGNRRTDKFPDYGKRFAFVQRIENRDSVVQNPDYNEQIFSGYHQLNLLNKIRFRLGEESDLTYSLNYSTTSDVPRYDRLIETDDNGQFNSAEWYYGPQKWLSNALNLNIYRKNAMFDQARVTIALQNLREGRSDRDFESDWLRHRREKVNVITANIDLERALDQKNTLFYGLEWLYNDVDSRGEETNIVTGISQPIRPRYPEGGSIYSGTALYISHKWLPNNKISLTSGLRYSFTRLKTLNRDFSNGPEYHKFTDSNGAINGSIGLAWLPSDGWQINAVVSTGFRAPNLDDMAKIFDGSNGIVLVPNTDLKPEYTYNTELGVTKSLEGKLKISATAFFTLLENPLVQEDFIFSGADTIYFDGEYSKTQALVNGGSARIYGGNVQLEMAITPALAMNSSFTVTRGTDSEGGPLRHTTPNFGLLGIRYQQYRFTGAINYQFSGARSYQDLPLSEQQKTDLYTSDGALAWQTLNFSGSYRFSKMLSFTLGVENILDHHYRPYSSGISAPGRNFIAALKCSFR